MSISYKETAHINYELFEEMRELLSDDFEELIKDHIDNSQDAIERLNDAFAENDNREGFEIAHKIKGASASLGLLRLSSLCSQMQDICRKKEIHLAAELVSLIQKEVIDTNIEIENRLN